MASKAFLLAAVALAAFAYVSANECYVCSSVITPGCDEEQGKNSNKFDCASQTPITGQDYNCGKIAYEIAGVQRVERTCVEKKYTCEDLQKQYKSQGIVLKECETCHHNLCNGGQ
ncbi:unnamed protein product [Callosobruchus maculatus]|uniref:Uncharacterized protein n=1 Tax=Callosobruchus maculatus TaxID=64391 RepID=A0A653CKF9_CALMS|nr:unnamed protein product [Callosobruchus maculatus]